MSHSLFSILLGLDQLNKIGLLFLSEKGRLGNISILRLTMGVILVGYGLMGEKGSLVVLVATFICSCHFRIGRIE